MSRTHLPGTADIQSWLDALCKSRHAWSEAHRESNKGAPVESMIVPVNAAVFIELVDVEFLLLDEIIVADHHTRKWTHKTRVA